MTAPSSTETPRHTATPWAGSLSVDLRKGALSVSADGLTLIDEKHVCWGIIFPDKTGNYDHAVTFTESVNSHASLTARVAELEADLAEDDRTIDSFSNVSPEQYQKEIAALLNQLRDAERALDTWDEHRDSSYWKKYPRAALDNADGGRGA